MFVCTHTRARVRAHTYTQTERQTGGVGEEEEKEEERERESYIQTGREGGTDWLYYTTLCLREIAIHTPHYTSICTDHLWQDR